MSAAKERPKAVPSSDKATQVSKPKNSGGLDHILKRGPARKTKGYTQ